MPDSPTYPIALRHEVRRAARLAHALAILSSRVPAEDASLPWLVGRADEVRTVVGGVMSAWSEGRLDARTARDRLRDYVRDMEESLGAFVRSQRTAATAPGIPRRRDTLVDG